MMLLIIDKALVSLLLCSSSGQEQVLKSSISISDIEDDLALLTLVKYSENITFSVLKLREGRLPPLFNNPFFFAALSQFNVVERTLSNSRLFVSLLIKLNLFLSRAIVMLVGDALTGSNQEELVLWL